MAHPMEDPPFPTVEAWQVMRWSYVDQSWVPGSNKHTEERAVEILEDLRKRSPSLEFRIIKIATAYTTTEH